MNAIKKASKFREHERLVIDLKTSHARIHISETVEWWKELIADLNAYIEWDEQGTLYEEPGDNPADAAVYSPWEPEGPLPRRKPHIPEDIDDPE